MSLIFQYLDKTINIIELSSEPGDKGKDVIVRSVTPEDLLGMLPKEEPKPPAEPPLPQAYAAIEGYPWLCVECNGTVVYRENPAWHAAMWSEDRQETLFVVGISPPAIADALRYIVDQAAKQVPELNLIVVANPSPK